MSKKKVEISLYLNCRDYESAPLFENGDNLSCTGCKGKETNMKFRDRPYITSYSSRFKVLGESFFF